MLATARIGRMAYRRRQPEQEPLYLTIAANLETFLDRARTPEDRIPSHVERELRDYLKCGILAHGFVRMGCEQCGESRVVAFSCKRRGLLSRVHRTSDGRYGGAAGR